MDRSDIPADGSPIPVLEEVAMISKRAVTTGVTTVEKQVQSRNYIVPEVLKSTGARVERIPMNQQVDATHPPQIRVEQGVTIVPILEERMVVEKRLFLKEELYVRPYVEEAHCTEEITLREEHVVLKRSLPPSQTD